MKKTTSARSPCVKIIWFFRQSLVVLPVPTIASNALGSSADFALRFIMAILVTSPLRRPTKSLWWPNGIRTRVPVPPHAYAMESKTCGAWADDDREGQKSCGKPQHDK